MRAGICALYLLLAAWAVISPASGQDKTDPALNRVSNPYFRSGVFSPEKWDFNRAAGNQVHWVCDRIRSGVNGVQLIGSGSDWAGLTSRTVPVNPGATVTIAAWVRSSGASPAADHVLVRFCDAKGFLGQEGPAIPASQVEWGLVSVAVRVPGGAVTADASVQVWSKATVWIGAMGLFNGDQTGRAASLLPRPELADPEIVAKPQGMAPDANNNGLPDPLERLLAVPPDAKSVRRTRRNTTCLQTPTGYVAENDLKVDTILVVNETREAIESWQAMGYRTPFMAGFRDGAEYLRAHPGSAQSDRSGKPLDCGPGSYYLVPTADRRAVMSALFKRAHASGAEGAAPRSRSSLGPVSIRPASKPSSKRPMAGLGGFAVLAASPSRLPAADGQNGDRAAAGLLRRRPGRQWQGGEMDAGPQPGELFRLGSRVSLPGSHAPA